MAGVAVGKVRRVPGADDGIADDRRWIVKSVTRRALAEFSWRLVLERMAWKAVLLGKFDSYHTAVRLVSYQPYPVTR